MGPTWQSGRAARTRVRARARAAFSWIWTCVPVHGNESQCRHTTTQNPAVATHRLHSSSSMCVARSACAVVCVSGGPATHRPKRDPRGPRPVGQASRRGRQPGARRRRRAEKLSKILHNFFQSHAPAQSRGSGTQLRWCQAPSRGLRRLKNISGEAQKIVQNFPPPPTYSSTDRRRQQPCPRDRMRKQNLVAWNHEN